MKKIRGIIALVVALVFGLLAVKMVANYVKRSQVPPPPPPIKAEFTPPAKPDTPFGLDVPEGMRAVSIPVDEVTGVSNRVKRGDQVDLIAVSAAPGKDGGRISRLLLQAVPVLAAAQDRAQTDKQEPPGTLKPVTKWVVTLLVTPTEAAMVTAADAAGKLALIVRNPEDLETAPDKTAMVFTNETGAKPYQEPRPLEATMDVRHKIESGKRAFTLEAKLTDGASGNIRPGDRVDIMLTSPYGHFASKGHDVGAEGQITETHIASRLFLQNVEVLAVGDQERVITQTLLPAPGEAAAPVVVGAQQVQELTEKIKTVVLHLTPEDAERLTVATDGTSKCIVRLILRNPKDNTEVATKGQRLIELLTGRYEYANVEVLRGNAMTERKFFRDIDPAAEFGNKVGDEKEIFRNPSRGPDTPYVPVRSGSGTGGAGYTGGTE